jgi:hypothetical protein
VDHPAPTFDADVRPWRRATLIVSGIAALELLLLIAIGVIALGRPFLHDAQTGGQHKPRATPAPVKAPASVTPRKRVQPVAPPRLARGETSVLVLNGNGRAGAAAAESHAVQSHGYVVASVGNARRADYARSLIMYRPGYRPEGLRLGRDLHVRLVTPLDGVRGSELMGAHLVVVVGR